MRSSSSPSPHFSHFFAGGDARFVGKHFVVGAIEIDDKFFPEFFHGIAPGELAFFNFVELFFEACGKGDVENIFKAFDQQSAHAFAQHGRRKTALLFCYVFALDDDGNDGGIGRRTADAFFFEFLDESRIVVTGRRLRKVLIGTDLVQL